MRPLVLSIFLLDGCPNPASPPPMASDADADSDTDSDADADADSDSDADPEEQEDTAPPFDLCTEDANEDNDSLSTALPLPSSLQDLAVLEEDRDFWTVPIGPWERLSLDDLFDANRGDIDANLYDADGVLIASGATGGDAEHMSHGNFSLEETSLTLEVFLWDGYPPECNTYAILVDREPLPACPEDLYEPDNTALEANLLPAALLGLNAHPANPDRFVLPANTGDAVHIRVEEDATTLGELQVTLFAPDGAPVAVDGFGPVYELEHVHTGLPGDFQVVITATDCVAYSLVGERYPSPDCSPDSQEPNNTLADALPLALGHHSSLSVSPSDVDHHAVQVPPGALLRVQMSTDFQFGTPTLRLLTADGTELALEDGSSGSYQLEWLNSDPTLTAELILQVEASSCLLYELDFELINGPLCNAPDSAEPNNTQGTAAPLMNLTDLESVSTDPDHYQISVPPFSALNVSLTTDGFFGQPELLLTDQQSLRLHLDQTGPTWAVRAHNDTADVVQWFLEVSSTDCLSYDLAPWTVLCTSDDPLEPNDRLVTAIPSTAGENLQVREDHDDYWSLGTLEPGASLRADVLFDHAAGDLDIELLLADGTVVSNDFTVTDNEVATWQNQGTLPEEVFLRVFHWPTFAATCINNRYSFSTEVTAP